MFCGYCANQIPDGYTVCPVCGYYLATDAQPQGYDYQTNQNMQMNATDMGYQNYENVKENLEDDVKTIAMARDDRNVVRNNTKNTNKEIFVDKNEKQISVLGVGYIQNLLHGGGFSKGSGVLTDKRYYYRGKSYNVQAGRFSVTDEECCVDLEDITSTGFIYTRNILLLIVGFACIAAGTLMMFSNAGGMSMGMVTNCIGIGLMILYLVSKRCIYTITHAGGSIGLNVSKYGGKVVVKQFDKEMRKAKDKAIAIRYNS